MNTLTARTITLPLLLCAFLPAQAPDTPTVEIDQPIARVLVTNIVAPVLVTDTTGKIVDGLEPNQFHLFDNGKEQNIQVDVSTSPFLW